MRPITIHPPSDYNCPLSAERLADWAERQYKIGAPCSVSDIRVIRLLCERDIAFKIGGRELRPSDLDRMTDEEIAQTSEEGSLCRKQE